MAVIVDRERWRGPALSLLRIVSGLIFLEHGTAKLLGFPPTDMAAPTMGSMMWLAGILEAFGGLLILLGLFTRPVAFILAGEMAVAYWMFHAPQSAFPLINGGDAAILYCFVFLLLAAAGPGPWSLDDGLKQRRIVGSRKGIADDAKTSLP